jgi:3-dehydroquinate synthase
VARSCNLKAAIVAGDEREREHGERALLNFGHTFGHALEAATGFGDTLLHGEAVALGMQLAFDLSDRLGFCSADTAARIRRHLAAMGLPTDVAQTLGGRFSPKQVLEPMQKDKKVKDGRLTLILVRGIGEAFIVQDVAPALLEEFLTEAMAPGDSYRTPLPP